MQFYLSLSHFHRRYQKGTYTRRWTVRPPAPQSSPDLIQTRKRMSRSLSDIIGLLENKACHHQGQVKKRQKGVPHNPGQEMTVSTVTATVHPPTTLPPLRKRRRRYNSSDVNSTLSSVACRSDSQVREGFREIFQQNPEDYNFIFWTQN